MSLGFAFDRRGFLRVGGAGVGGGGVVGRLAPPTTSDAGSTGGDRQRFGKAKSVLHVHLSDGLSQLDMRLAQLDQALASLMDVFGALRVNQDTQSMDPIDRPHSLCNGNVIAPHYTGRSG